jgi:hypothetical protein
MGCAESREQSGPQGPSSQPLLSILPSSDDDNELCMMGQPQLTPQRAPGGPSQLSSQHERLILELLPFKELGQFHEYVFFPANHTLITPRTTI